MNGHEESQMESLIHEAQRRLIRNGTDGTDVKDIYLAAIGWHDHRDRERHRDVIDRMNGKGNGRRREQVTRIGVPAGLATAIVALIELGRMLAG